jgi:hypothetical protein
MRMTLNAGSDDQQRPRRLRREHLRRQQRERSGTPGRHDCARQQIQLLSRRSLQNQDRRLDAGQIQSGVVGMDRHQLGDRQLRRCGRHQEQRSIARQRHGDARGSAGLPGLLGAQNCADLVGQRGIRQQRPCFELVEDLHTSPFLFRRLMWGEYKFDYR